MAAAVNDGGYWISCRHVSEDLGAGDDCGRRRCAGRQSIVGFYKLDTGRHHHYTAKPSHLPLSTLSQVHGSAEQRRRSPGDVIHARLICSGKANKPVWVTA